MNSNVYYMLNGFQCPFVAYLTSPLMFAAERKQS